MRDLTLSELDSQLAEQLPARELMIVGSQCQPCGCAPTPPPQCSPCGCGCGGGGGGGIVSVDVSI